MTAGSETPSLDWGVASRTYPGQRECGDAHLVAPYAGGVLAAVADGLGHGHEAALASKMALTELARTAGKGLTAAVRECHEAVRRTRGVALSVVAIEPTAITWLGVGNVEAVLFSPGEPRRRESLVPRAGVVGYHLPSLRETRVPIAGGDVLVLATDGVSTRFSERPPPPGTAARIAHELLEAYAKPDDDALVLVLRREPDA